MLSYVHVSSLVTQMPAGSNQWQAVVDALVDMWLLDYGSYSPGGEVVETTNQGFSYLFDIAAQRLIAAWGVSSGKNTEPRPASRMAGAPLGGPEGYHRGHAIPHTLGGGTDINLVPQAGWINVGPFRPLEKTAVATPGAFYFTYWTYRSATGQRPTGVEQGLLQPGQPAEVVPHGN
ncbi:hypothetical protein ACFOD9_05950 [Novosphingobium bradum]|uniref:Uncharacterized protein n=1 Tax=Novosphingobium bradum TaxID=1737444 RepID=A0ABV7IQ92_9SPHN